MPGFLGGSGGATSGTGGEITFPKEFIDPVTKLRVSNPENLIDTDFEYGLQPTKWETVELINNTPSFFSKSGDTTIPGIRAITTNSGTREITVETGLDHGLAVGIPINVQGTKSVTADGSYIINSIPDTRTFTYLSRDIQENTSAIEDLYTSIITGEFFQGSQLKISESDGIVTDAATISELTVTTQNPHGFGPNTPFYFLNLNSTISQEFEAANTEAKSFDASNSATAQTFDGSNSLSSLNIDWSNSATIGGTVSTVDDVDTVNNTITVAHSTENFSELSVGQPLYYSVNASLGYFFDNPRGVVFLKDTNNLGTGVSTFQVSEVPDGPAINIQSNMTGSFQIANQARTFAGNNTNSETETTISVDKGTPQVFDATNTTGTEGEVTGYSGGQITVESTTELEWYSGTMLFYSTTGSSASGLTNNTTYFVDSFFRQSTSDLYSFTLKPLPDDDVINSISGGTGTQTFSQIFISIDKDVIHVKDNGFSDADMLEYEYPANGRFGVETQDQIVDFYFVATKYDAHNLLLIETTGALDPKTVSITVDRGTEITPTTATPIGLTAPITFAVTSGTLPTGLSLDTSTGSVSGTPVEVVESPGREVVITATDADETEVFQTHTYIINATVGSIDPETVSRENIFAGEAMTATPTPTTENLVEPIVWDVSSNNLPTGLSFDTSTGVISGTPEEEIPEPGRDVIVRATDVGGLEAFQTVTFQINEPPELYSFTSATFTTGGASGRNGPNITQARNGVGNPSWASDYLNMTTNGIQLWTVPKTGVYTIDARGAAGGDSSDRSGGQGYRLRGNVTLTQGAVLEIVVGQRGTPTSSFGGGGGGTYVWDTDDTAEPIIVAGGGGGSSDQIPQGQNAVSVTSGTSNADNSASGGSGGNGGSFVGGQYPASGGAGWKSNGQHGHTACSTNSTTPFRPLEGAVGGIGGGGGGPGTMDGGFGGGGGGAQRCGSAGGGGGGGYSGGGGGNFSQNGGDSGGGGGGSYFTSAFSSSDRTNLGNHGDNNGSVTITLN